MTTIVIVSILVTEDPKLYDLDDDGRNRGNADNDDPDRRNNMLTTVPIVTIPITTVLTTIPIAGTPMTISVPSLVRCNKHRPYAPAFSNFPWTCSLRFVDHACNTRRTE
jgi:hypothetical protein